MKGASRAPCVDEGVRQNFQRHVPVERRVRRSIDDAHAAFPETARDLEDPEAAAYL